MILRVLPIIRSCFANALCVSTLFPRTAKTKHFVQLVELHNKQEKQVCVANNLAIIKRSVLLNVMAQRAVLLDIVL